MPELDGVAVTSDDLKSLALTNYGHYTSMRADDRYVRGLSLHLDRLVHDCQRIFNSTLDRDQLREFICRAARKQCGSVIVRVTVFDPSLDIGKVANFGHPRILVTTRPAVTLPAPPLRVRTAIYHRDLPQVKHIGLFGALWHRRNAQLHGFDDVLFTDDKFVISEGATWNIAFFDGERVIWPDAETLPGVTMRLLQQVHRQTVTAPVTVLTAARMHAVFATNTTVGVRPISRINNLTFPESHMIFETLLKEYMTIPTEAL